MAEMLVIPRLQTRTLRHWKTTTLRPAVQPVVHNVATHCHNREDLDRKARYDQHRVEVQQCKVIHAINPVCVKNVDVESRLRWTHPVLAQQTALNLLVH